jgi:CubicO group peptidase (beta-lactamase class C family)
MGVKGQLPRPVLGYTLAKSRSNGPVVLYLAGILLSWIICTQTLDIRVQIRGWHPQSAGTSQISHTCKPFLPSNLLQIHPPSSSDPSFSLPIRQFELQVSIRASMTATDSITVGIVSSNGLIWSKGFGRARANGTEITPPNEHTIYRMASVSKLFATMETFILRDRGIINWY